NIIKERFRDAPFYLKIIYIKEGEGIITALLNDLLTSHPKILLGSYPVLDHPDYKVKLTLESKERDVLNQASEKLLSMLPLGSVHGVEDN
ncbi:MAG: hypothetical protein QF619_09060, partial [Candidatus Binatia bacterium]|nr:hypothetical protein [Candidatus Binatia bacterium]